MCVVLYIRNDPIHEAAIYEKTDHPVYETVISKGSELGADVQLQDNPSYGIVGCCYNH